MPAYLSTALSGNVFMKNARNRKPESHGESGDVRAVEAGRLSPTGFDICVDDNGHLMWKPLKITFSENDEAHIGANEKFTESYKRLPDYIMAAVIAALAGKVVLANGDNVYHLHVADAHLLDFYIYGLHALQAFNDDTRVGASL